MKQDHGVVLFKVCLDPAPPCEARDIVHAPLLSFWCYTKLQVPIQGARAMFHFDTLSNERLHNHN